ncbi:Hypothetical protein c0583 [Escherichia coli CFT073]|uniref:Uncharacterized protein n=1 Tax=Escherichia coli O6:H1 (strain CFT073 / ATCC 700928 / UPEC) TaxID=199310 RepID=A0A0H2V6Y7_ECOL6|nr:Hypothetical protein c0583 [Escherichia coli CFT073]
MTFSGRSSGSETFIHHDYVPVLQTITAFCFFSIYCFCFCLVMPEHGVCTGVIEW